MTTKTKVKKYYVIMVIPEVIDDGYQHAPRMYGTDTFISLRKATRESHRVHESLNERRPALFKWHAYVAAIYSSFNPVRPILTAPATTKSTPIVKPKAIRRPTPYEPTEAEIAERCAAIRKRKAVRA